MPIERLDKRTWRVRARRPGRCTLRYRVYANELTVRTSHLDGTHGYFNGATLFLYSEGLRDSPQHLTVDAPPGWSMFTALERTDGGWQRAETTTSSSTAPSRSGRTRPIRFRPRGVPHEVVVWGEQRRIASKLGADLAAVCEAEAALFGGLPMPRYLFLLYLDGQGPGRAGARGVHRAALPAGADLHAEGLGGLPHPRLRTSTSTSGT